MQRHVDSYNMWCMESQCIILKSEEGRSQGRTHQTKHTTMTHGKSVAKDWMPSAIDASILGNDLSADIEESILVPEEVFHKHLHWSSLLHPEVAATSFFVCQLEAC